MAFGVGRAYEYAASVFVTDDVLETAIEAGARWSLTAIRKFEIAAARTTVGKGSLCSCRNSIRSSTWDVHVRFPGQVYEAVDCA